MKVLRILNYAVWTTFAVYVVALAIAMARS
jgi:hypothetical protein